MANQAIKRTEMEAETKLSIKFMFSLGERGSNCDLLSCEVHAITTFAYFNGVYSLKWRLTDRYLRWGTLAGPRPGRADADQCKSSDFLQELRVSGSRLCTPTHTGHRDWFGCPGVTAATELLNIR